MCPETTRSVGQRGENIAARYLEARGLRLLERNYRCRGGEIDLVMLDGSTLVLVEVRLRSSADFGGAAASVGPRKQRRLVHAARHLMMTRHEFREWPIRFDVVALEGSPAGERVDWIRDAFSVA